MPDPVTPMPGMDLLQALDDIAETPRPRPQKPDRATLKAVSHEAGFPSRDPPPPPKSVLVVRTRGQKRQLSGRSYRFSVKMRPEDVQRIYDIAEEQNWLIAEVIERALTLLDGAKPKKP